MLEICPCVLTTTFLRVVPVKHSFTQQERDPQKMEIEPKGAKTMTFKLEHCKPENHEASKKVIFKGCFSRRKCFKEGLHDSK